MTNIKVDKVARLILNADGTYTTVTEEDFNGKYYHVYIPQRDTLSCRDRRWREISLDHARCGHGVYPYGVSANDVRYGAFHRFNKVMVELARLYKSLFIPKAYVDIYRTRLRRQWEALSDYDLGVLRHQLQGRYMTDSLIWEIDPRYTAKYGHPKHIFDLER